MRCYIGQSAITLISLVTGAGYAKTVPWSIGLRRAPLTGFHCSRYMQLKNKVLPVTFENVLAGKLITVHSKTVYHRVNILQFMTLEH